MSSKQSCTHDLFLITSCGDPKLGLAARRPFWMPLPHVSHSDWIPTPITSELASGILVTSQIEELTLKGEVTARGIVTRLGTTYHKKARGKIRAVCDFNSLPTAIGKHELTVRAGVLASAIELSALSIPPHKLIFLHCTGP